MEQERKIRVAITHGDTNGTGYEAILKAFDDPTMFELCTPIVYGSPKVAAYHRKALGIETQFSIINQASEARDGRLNLLTCFEEEVKVDLGQPTDESADAARKALDRAVADQKEGLIDVLVALPFQHFDHATYLQQQLAAQQRPLSILVNEAFRLALVTSNVAIKDVSEAITRQTVAEKGTLLHQALRRDLRISNPRIAILALNPENTEEGGFGEEEHDAILPAIDELSKKGIQAFGPYAAHDFFGQQHYDRFDGVLAMYRDQGLTPLRTIAPEGSTTLVTTLPLVVTLPDMTPGYDIAGQGAVEAQPLRDALYLAIDASRNRKNYEEPYENPLPKLYHERREDGEKVRFAVPKKKDDRGERKDDRGERKEERGERKDERGERKEQEQQGDKEETTKE